jgi:microcystin degradation protein MlrC
MKRVLFAYLVQETCSFATTKFDLESFRRYFLDFGDEVLLRHRGGGLEPAGAIAAAEEEGLELVPVLASYGGTGGPVTDETYAFFRERVLDAARREASSVDGVLLCLHGAMVTESLDDPEGDLLPAVRQIVGPEVPLVISLDLHAHFTEAMAGAVDAVVAYHTFPHVDFYDTGYRAMKLLGRVLRGEVRPVVAHRKLPMITSAEPQNTTRPLGAEVMGRVLAAEGEPGVLAAAILMVQPQLDLPNLGWSVVVTANANRELAQNKADEIGEFAWQNRRRFHYQRTPVSEALRRAREGEGGPYVLADTADATSGGAEGDSTWLLRGLLAEPVPGQSLVLICDPEAVAACVAAGVREEVEVEVGGKLAPAFSQPVQVRGRVRTLSDGRFQMKHPQMPADRGRTAVLQVGEVYIVLSEKPVYTWDEECYRSVGLFPREAKVVQVKAQNGFRPVYEPFAKEIMELDAPGPTDGNLRRLPYKRVTRPLFPLDDI